MKQTRKRPILFTLFLLVILLTAALALSACGSRNPLVGSWMEPNSGVVMEINNDGEVSMTLNGASITLKYTTEEPDVIILLATADGSIPEQRMTYKVTEDKLVLMLDGVKTTFFRLK